MNISMHVEMVIMLRRWRWSELLATVPARLDGKSHGHAKVTKAYLNQGAEVEYSYL